ncbi:hypothetical protein D3C78_1364400 [compost metagenome]
MLDHRQGLAIADDEVVEHPDINELQCRLQTAGQHQVSMTGLTHARWMVMAKNQCRRIVCQGALDDFSGIDAGAVDRAAKQHFKT